MPDSIVAAGNLALTCEERGMFSKGHRYYAYMKDDPNKVGTFGHAYITAGIIYIQDAI